MALIHWSTDLEKKALAEGRTAFEEGYDENDNPWLDSTREYVAWLDGWNEGQLAAEAKREVEIEDMDVFLEPDVDGDFYECKLCGKSITAAQGDDQNGHCDECAQDDF
jgi:hypothetical protein